MFDTASWNALIEKETPLQNFPNYQWKIKKDSASLPIFVSYKTVSRHLAAYSGSNSKICPYGDLATPVALLEKTDTWNVARDAYSLSALRFKLGPFSLRQTKSRPSNSQIGFPTAVKHLHRKSHQIDIEQVLKAPSIKAFETGLENVQQQARQLFVSELLPCINANPLDVSYHRHKLPPEFAFDLATYIELQNRPYLFFDLLQWLERDVARHRRVLLSAGKAISLETVMIQVMRSWRDRDGHRRKKPIVFPIGVPIGYIQSIRRKGQPYITKEFGYHSHGALNHWLQEHIWRRFCYRYPDKHQLHPCEFLRKMGTVHCAIPDAIYELHTENVANPANTHFWAVLQYYLPLLSPWP